MRANGSRVTTASVGGVSGAEYEIEGYYTPRDPGRTMGEPEHCYPPEPATAEPTRTWRLLEDGTRVETDIGAAVDDVGEEDVVAALFRAAVWDAQAYEEGRADYLADMAEDRRLEEGRFNG